jgi:hypothetical protein
LKIYYLVDLRLYHEQYQVLVFGAIWMGRLVKPVAGLLISASEIKTAGFS